MWNNCSPFRHSLLYLEVQELESVQCVCRSWRDGAKSNEVWWPITRRHLMHMAKTWQGKLYCDEKKGEGKSESKEEEEMPISIGEKYVYMTDGSARGHLMGLILSIHQDWPRWGAKTSYQDQFYQLHLLDAVLLWVDIQDGSVFVLPDIIRRFKPRGVQNHFVHQWLRTRIRDEPLGFRNEDKIDEEVLEQANEYVFRMILDCISRIRRGHTFCIHIGSTEMESIILQGKPLTFHRHPKTCCEQRASSLSVRFLYDKWKTMNIHVEYGTRLFTSSFFGGTEELDVNILNRWRMWEIELQKIIMGRTSHMERLPSWPSPCSFRHERTHPLLCPIYQGGASLYLAPWRCGVQGGFNVHSLADAPHAVIHKQGCGAYMGPGCISPHTGYVASQCKHWNRLDSWLCDSCIGMAKTDLCARCRILPISSRPRSSKRLQVSLL